MQKGEKIKAFILQVIICKLLLTPFHCRRLTGENKATAIVMRRNISKKSLNLWQLEGMSTGEEERGERRVKQLIENIKRFLNYFWKETQWNRLWRESILIICIIRQEQRRAVPSSSGNLCKILNREWHETLSSTCSGPRLFSVITQSREHLKNTLDNIRWLHMPLEIAFGHQRRTFLKAPQVTHSSKHFPSPTVFLCFCKEHPKKGRVKKTHCRLLRMQSIKSKLLTSSAACASEQSGHLWKKTKWLHANYQPDGDVRLCQLL